jgi:hypothetical protein
MRRNKGNILYASLWGVASVIIAVIIITGYREQLPQKSFFNGHVIDNHTSSGETINELMLSANELTITEKKSFINLYLKSTDVSSVIAYTKDSDEQKRVYNQIFQRKMKNLKNKNSDGDFSVKPVPK